MVTSSAKHALRNTPNDCHQCLSDSSRVHQAYDAPPDPIVGWGGGNPLPILHPPRCLRNRATRRLGRLVSKASASLSPHFHMSGYAADYIKFLLHLRYRNEGRSILSRHIILYTDGADSQLKKNGYTIDNLDKLTSWKKNINSPRHLLRFYC